MSDQGNWLIDEAATAELQDRYETDPLWAAVQRERVGELLERHGRTTTDEGELGDEVLGSWGEL